MKSEKFTFTKHIRFGRFIKMSILSAMLTMWYSGIQAQCPLACNNLVQVSMDEDCIVQITPDMMLQGNGTLPTCTYVVQVLTANGQPLAPPIGYSGNDWITSANVGQTLTVRVWLGTNSCWGTIKIEDKLAPSIECPRPITIACWDPRSFAFPDAFDNCGGNPVVSLLSDVTTELECTDPFNRAVRVIRYQAKDASGNLSEICTRRITYSKITLDDLKFPKNYDGTSRNRPHLECDGGWAWGAYQTNASGTLVPFTKWDKNNNNYPDPEETGAPYVADPLNITGYILGYKVGTGPSFNPTLPQCTSGNLVGYDVATGTWQTSCGATTGQVQNFRIDTFYNSFIGNNTLCKINTTFSDTRIDICAKSFKVLRQWTVLDWCTGRIIQKYQIIKVVDDEGPVVTIPTDIPAPAIACVNRVSSVIQADPYTCTGIWNVLSPINVFDCSDWDYSIAFLLADANGGPPQNGFYVTQNGETKVEQLSDDAITKRNRYRIVGLPLGCTWVRYSVYDECGNITYAFTEIFVEDKTPPVAVCDQFTVVTLSNNGWAHVFAETFDDGSHDNCTKVTLLVRRRTAGCNSNGSADEGSNPFGPFVQFCCEDVGRDVMVELQVTDAFGNKNSCMVIAQAQDKVPPVITCPQSVTISCGADTSATILGKPVFSATALTTPYFTDNCPDPKMSWKNSGIIDNCGQGVITRTFTVTDKGGRTASCSQTITVRNTTPYNGPTSWPTSPKEVSGCMNVDTDPSKTGTPTLGNGACSQVAYTYEDQVFPFVDGVCFKILRKWTVIDWCKFSPSRDPNGNLYPAVPTLNINMWQFTQIIKVSETVKPVITNTSKAPTDAFGDNCTGYVDLPNSATDCTPAAQLRWTYFIDLFNDGIIINTPNANSNNNAITGSKNDASGTYPVGTHKITWTVEDMCGNQATSTYTFEVRDRKKPTPYCISQLATVVMPSSGNITIWAKDFDKGSSDNCPGKLWFTFNGARPVASIVNNPNLTNAQKTHYFKGNGIQATQAEFECGTAQQWRQDDCSSSLYYRCKIVGCDNGVGLHEVQMSVWDKAENTDYCTVSVDIQANGTACAGSRIAGDISTEDNEMVQDVQVILQNTSNNETKSLMTNNVGRYEFTSMPELVNYKVIPEKDVDHLNGVSTLDLVMIQRHILGIEKFNLASKYVAGDVTKDNKVTAGDLVELRKLILGIYNKFPANKSWRFLDKSVIITDITNPWAINEYINIDNFNTSMMSNNFIAVKIGDINSSAVTNVNNPTSQNRGKQSLTLVTMNKAFTDGETVKMEVTSDNFVNMIGAQWTLNFDASSLEYQNVVPGALKINKENLNDLQASNGKITLSWNESKGQTITNEKVLFTIEFRATANNTIEKTVKVSSDITKAEAYTSDLSEMNVGLEYRSNTTNNAVFSLDQNNPNPFTANTVIGFTLPSSADAKLTIYDITGKVVKTIKGVYPKGRSEINITSEDINAQGVLFYELESNGLKATKKLIYLNK
ncbi:MAG: T9SS type A sorting domain-containing protein [Saprospiraceae bacterium]|nr:T9SS type A sorting domain-containing protein [Saprospiraceae bacterium]